jgi:hypothetical protein
MIAALSAILKLMIQKYVLGTLSPMRNDPLPLSEETAVLCYNSKTTYPVVARLKMNITLKENSFPPRTIHDENGTWTGVILSVPDFQIFLRLLIEYADWESLPSYLQDAVDNMLADEAEEEEGEYVSLDKLLGEP